jgi:glutamine amidotransferase
MQLLASRGVEHGVTEGLDWIAGVVRLIERTDPAIKVPHMGWNQVRQCRAHALWGGIEDLARFYFVHSYFVDPAPQVRDVLTIGQSEYGVPFTAAVARDNIVAVQFHPEKSQASGLRLLANFALWNP